MDITHGLAGLSDKGVYSYVHTQNELYIQKEGLTY